MSVNQDGKLFRRCENVRSLEFHTGHQEYQCSRIIGNLFGSSIFYKGTKFKFGALQHGQYLCSQIPLEYGWYTQSGYFENSKGYSIELFC